MASNYQITVTLEGRDSLSDELRQVNQQLGQIVTNTASTSNSMTRMETSLSGLRTGFGNMNGMLQQFGLGLSAMGIARAVTDLNDLGREVEAVETTFEQLSGGPDAARRSLENMREITGGVVDDMTLMRGANSLLLTGLASTNDQAAELVNLGYRLSAAMGVDATEGIQNLNAALLNNSFARLDTLGISAGQVRERVQELKDEGYNMSEAFSQAVLEQGRAKLELLGEAATTGETAFNRLATGFKNARNALAEWTAQGLESAAGSLEDLYHIAQLIGEHGLDNVVAAAQGQTVDLAAQERARRITEMALAERDALMGDTGSTFRDQIDTEALANLAQTDPDMFRRISEGGVFTNMVWGAPGQASSTSGIAPEGLEAIFSQFTGGMQLDRMEQSYAAGFVQELDVQLGAIASTMREVTAEEAALAEQADRLGAASAYAAEREAEWLDVEERRLANARIAERANSTEQQTLADMEAMYGRLAQSATQFQDIGGVQIMDPAEADEIINRADAMEQRFETLQQLAEDTEFQYISEDELGWAEEMSNQASTLADQAERASAAFEKMSLAQMMGTSGGGRLGEMTDMVTGAIGDEGIAAQVELELDLRSGRTTELEQAFEDEFANTIAQIAEQVGPEAAADAAQRALAALEQGQLLGMTDAEIEESVRGAIGAVDFSRSEDAGLRLIEDQNRSLANTNIPVDVFDVEQKDPMQSLETKLGETIATDPTTKLENMEAIREEVDLLGASALATGDAFATMYDHMTTAAQAAPTVARPLPGELDAGDMGGTAPLAAGTEAATPQENLAAMGEQVAALEEQIVMVNESANMLAMNDYTGVMDPFVHSFETADTAMSSITAKLDAVAGKSYRTTVAIDVLLNDPTGAGAALFTGAMAQATANNGGIPPGTTGVD